jgi:hypothetical protein
MAGTLYLEGNQVEEDGGDASDQVIPPIDLYLHDIV